jgi:hypothetical protein
MMMLTMKGLERVASGIEDEFRGGVPLLDLHTETVEPKITRVASGAYSASDDGAMSVEIQRWMHEDQLDDLHYLPDETQGATRIRVGDLRALGLKVGWDPDSGHAHHGAVWGVKTTHRKKIAKKAKTLRKAEGET